MIFYSHCKINIGLRVTAKRPDGFHNIESLFYPVTGVADAIEIVEDSTIKDIEFTTSGITIDCASEKNLCVRAYRLLQQRYNISGVKMHLHKNIPMGAGLGGGSANCAAAIKGLNTVFNLGLDTQTMCHIAAELGSDVPFFIEQQPAWVSGRGEILEKAEVSLDGLYLIIIKPEVHVGTAWAYSRITPDDSRANLRDQIAKGTANWKANIDNDFEKAIFGEFEQIKQLKQSLYTSGAVFALMSGSGAAVYGIFDKEPKEQINFDGQTIVFQGVIQR